MLPSIANPDHCSRRLRPDMRKVETEAHLLGSSPLILLLTCHWLWPRKAEEVELFQSSESLTKWPILSNTYGCKNTFFACAGESEHFLESPDGFYQMMISKG